MPNANEIDNSYMLSKKNVQKTKNKSNINLNEIDIDKIIATLDTITTILKNKDNIEMVLSGFSQNPQQLVGMLSKVSSLKGVMDSSNIDISALIEGLQEK